MNTAAPTARPPSAAIAWASGDSLFVEYQTKSGVPYIVRFRRTAEDLAKALGILIESPAPTGLALVQDSHPTIRRNTSKFTESQRKAANETLKKLGII